MLVNIPEDVVARQEKLAEAQGSTVGDVLKTLLNRYAPDTQPGSLAEMAQNAQEAGTASSQSVDKANVAARF